MRSGLARAGVLAAVALCAIAAWPFFVADRIDRAQASALPTMAPVTRDDLQRDKLVAFWERGVDEHLRGDMLSPTHLSAEYLQRYRERADIDDALRAERAARLALHVDPHYLPAILQMAAVELTLHRFYDALALVGRAQVADPGDPPVVLREASLDMEVGRYARAERILAMPRLAKDDPISYDTMKSRLLEETGHLAEARRLLATAGAYENANFDAPAQARAWYFFREGEMAFESGDADTAVTDEREALAVFPNFADASRALARVECALHRWQDCLRDATRSANIVPYPETLGYEADAQRALGDLASARATDDLIDAVERIGNAQRISDRLLAVYDSEHGRHLDDAYRIARRELTARDDIYTEDTLGWAAAMDGRWDEARTAMRKALRFDTEDARLQYHAGVVAQHFGDVTEAKARFTRALALNPQFHPTYADDARARLHALSR